MPTAEEALRIIRACGRSGAFSLSQYAHARALNAGHSQADLMHALAHATRCTPNSGDRWAVDGPSLDGNTITMFVVLDSGTLSVV